MKTPALLFWLGLSLSLSLGLAGCARGPVPLPSPEGQDPAAAARCLAVFPTPPWRALHRIEAHFPGGGEAAFLGLSQLAGGRLRCLLMSPEGAVFLDAEMGGGEPKVYRALPPFDRGSLAQGLLADVALLFRPPDGRLVGAAPQGPGWRADWVTVAGEREQISVAAGGDWRLTRWDADAALLREATGSRRRPDGWAGAISLEAPGEGYRLDLTLLEAGPPQ
ncbi:MAG: DUF3261 domain-containing protein [Deltaproteobacteria bacterium]|nr:DUF3261 domain-containing protein [Deltaproteobacteria bacterium]